MRFLNRWVEPIYALLRVVAGLLFAFHGAQKLFGAFGGQVAGEPLMILAGVIELGGGLLIALGLFTSIAAFVASGEMAVAYFMAHAPQGPWPIQNGGELAALYSFLFLYIAARGGGPYSVDGRFGKRKA
ncbi:MAG TPA: DoxX family protein [Thermoanaerobaculia bacterium]